MEVTNTSMGLSYQDHLLFNIIQGGDSVIETGTMIEDVTLILGPHAVSKEVRCKISKHGLEIRNRILQNLCKEMVEVMVLIKIISLNKIIHHGKIINLSKIMLLRKITPLSKIIHLNKILALQDKDKERGPCW